MNTIHYQNKCYHFLRPQVLGIQERLGRLLETVLLCAGRLKAEGREFPADGEPGEHCVRTVRDLVRIANDGAPPELLAHVRGMVEELLAIVAGFARSVGTSLRGDHSQVARFARSQTTDRRSVETT